MRNFANDLSDILSVESAAEELCIAPRTLHHWIKDGKIAATKLGTGRTSPYFITRAEVERKLQELREGRKPKTASAA